MRYDELYDWCKLYGRVNLSPFQKKFLKETINYTPDGLSYQEKVHRLQTDALAYAYQNYLKAHKPAPDGQHLKYPL